jgi:hypothetical protein
MNWITSLFNKQQKTAEQVDANIVFERKVKAHDWVEPLLDSQEESIDSKHDHMCPFCKGVDVCDELDCSEGYEKLCDSCKPEEPMVDEFRLPDLKEPVLASAEKDIKVGDMVTITHPKDPQTSHLAEVIDVYPIVADSKKPEDILIEVKLDDRDKILTLPLSMVKKAAQKQAAYENGDTVEDTIKKDYDLHVESLSDYVLAEMLTEYTLQGQGLPERWNDEHQKQAKYVKNNRKEAESKLLKLVGEHTAIDWKAAFKRFEETELKTVKEKDLYKPEFKPGKQNWEKGEEFKGPSDKERIKGMEGVGKEEKKGQVGKEAFVKPSLKKRAYKSGDKLYYRGHPCEIIDIWINEFSQDPHVDIECKDQVLSLSGKELKQLGHEPLMPKIEHPEGESVQKEPKIHWPSDRKPPEPVEEVPKKEVPAKASLSENNIEADSLQDKEHLAENRSTPPEVLTQLSKDEDPNVRYGVAYNPNTPPEVLTQLSKDKDSDIRWNVAHNPNTPPEVLTQLSKDKDEEVRWAVAGISKTPPEVLTQLSKDNDPNIRLNVAHNLNTPPEVLTQLSKDRDSDIRYHVARNHKTPPEALTQLSKDKDEDVRRAVAQNHNTPPEVKKQLERDASEIHNIEADSLQDKEHLAYTSRSPEILKRLSRDRDFRVRYNVAENIHGTPSEILMYLSKDRDEEVRAKVAENTKTPPEALTQLSKDRDPNVRLNVAQNPKTPPEVLTQLSRDRDDEIRESVARNDKTPTEVLLQLSKDKNEEVQRAVAHNYKAPPEILVQELSKTPDNFTKCIIAQNPKTPPEVLTQLSRDRSARVRYFVAHNSKTPLEVLKQLSKDKSASVRCGVADNDKTPPEILIQLSKDPNGDVREYVGMNDNAPPEALKQLERNASLKKVAEVDSPWKVIKDVNGNEVIARITPGTNQKKSKDKDKKEIQSKQ